MKQVLSHAVLVPRSTISFAKVYALLSYAFLALIVGSNSSCKAKPSKESCKEAVENIQRINNSGNNNIGTTPASAIRGCQALSSKATVQCIQEAKTPQNLRDCEGEIGKKYFKEEEEALRKKIEDSKEHNE